MADMNLVRHRALSFTLLLGTLAAAVGLYNAYVFPGVSWVNYLGLGIILVIMPVLYIAYAWRKVDEGTTALVAIATITASFAVQYIYGLFAITPELALHERIPPLGSWVPLIFVASFMFLKQRHALAIAGSFYLVTALATIAFFLLNVTTEADQSTLVATFHQYVLAHPIFIALLYMVPSLRDEYRNVISEREKLEERAHTDSLTGVLNRRGLEARINRRIQRELSNDMVFGVIVVRILSLSRIAENYSADAVEEVLCETARLIAAESGPDLPLGRWNDKSFVIILPPKQLHRAEQVLERILQVLRSRKFQGSEGAEFRAVITRSVVGEDFDQFVHRMREDSDACVKPLKAAS